MKLHYKTKYGYGEKDFIANFIEKKSLFDEVIKLAKRKNPLEQRLAYIMTDHLVEVILNDGLERIIAECYNYMFSPRLDGNTFNKLRMNFDAKLEFFSTAMPQKVETGISFVKHYQLTTDEAKILGVLHRYRNDMYHRDQINKTVLRLLTVIYADYALRVFVRFSDGGMGIGVVNRREKIELSGLLDNSFLYPSKASMRLKKRLLPRSQSKNALRSKLVKSLEDRYREVVRVLEQDLPSSTDPKVQAVLATQVILANDLAFSLEENKEYRALLEARKVAFNVKDYGELAKLTQLMQEFQLKAVTDFESELSYADFLAIKQQIETLKLQDQFADILTNYYETDQKILVYRDRIIQGAIDFDKEVQRQIDESRGK